MQATISKGGAALRLWHCADAVSATPRCLDTVHQYRPQCYSSNYNPATALSHRSVKRTSLREYAETGAICKHYSTLIIVLGAAGSGQARGVRCAYSRRCQNPCRCRTQHFASQVRIIAVVEQMGAWDSTVSFPAAPASAASTSLCDASTTVPPSDHRHQDACSSTCKAAAVFTRHRSINV